MKLNRNETHTIMCALQEYSGLFVDDEDLLDHIEKLAKRFEKKYEKIKAKGIFDG